MTGTRELVRQVVAGAVAVLVVVLALVVWTTTAGACSCAVVADGEAFEAAEAVFLGSLIETIPPTDPMRGSGAPERFVFEVAEVFKGDVTTRQTVVTAAEGASCGLELSGSGPFLVFATTDSPSELGVAAGELSSDLCSGSRPLDQDPLPAAFGRSSPPEGAAASAPGPLGGGTDREGEAGGLGTGPAVAAAAGAFAAVAAAALLLRRRAS